MLVNYFFISEINLKNVKNNYLIDHHFNTFMSEYQNFLILSHLSETIEGSCMVFQLFRDVDCVLII